MSTDPRQFWTIAEWCADAAATARRQAISECAEVCDKVCSWGGMYDYPYYSNGADACAEAIRALLTRPEEARGGEQA